MRRWLAMGLTVLTLIGCVPPTGLKTSAVLRGRLSFATKKKQRLKTQMLPEDLVANATISIVDPTHVTAAAGITDASGAFTLTVPAPATGTYQIIAAKRVAGNGRQLELTTYAYFDSPTSTWLSLTHNSPTVIINPVTTAVALVGNAAGVDPLDMLEMVEPDPDTSEYTLISSLFKNGTGADLSSLGNDVADQVYTLVDVDVDPIRGVCYISGASAASGATITAATPGMTLVKVLGFGFDPVPDRNNVGFQVGKQFYWTPALPGSTQTSLLVRVPAIPPPDSTTGSQVASIHVRNGVGALEMNTTQVPLINLQSPKTIPNPGIQLASNPGSPILSGMAVGPLSGYVHLVWMDGSLGSLTPMAGIWNLSANALASLPAQVSNQSFPNVAGDPGFFPQVYCVETNGTPLQVQTNVIWQGIDVQTNTNAVFHRTALNGAWTVYNGPGGPSASASLAMISGGPGQDCIAPSAVNDTGNRVFCAFGDRYTAGRYNIKAKLWKGTFHNNVADWANAATTNLLTFDGNDATNASLPKVAVSYNGNGGVPLYHVVWNNYNPLSPSSGSLQYRVGQPDPTFTSITWLPTLAGSGPPATWQPGVGQVDDLALAADTAGDLMSVWLVNGALVSKSIGPLVPIASIGSVSTVAVPPLPNGATETSPRLVAVGTNEFYMISASTTTSASQAGEIWVRHFQTGAWSQPVNISNSPSVMSSYPNLAFANNTLTASWQEGSTLTYLPLVLPL